ncbi:permease [Wukongibacter baidiensis]|uniref:permease n=1 Tax=Wukongibacter baidiensis TaxID=1723361 RepID=UPI003D7F7D69
MNSSMMYIVVVVLLLISYVKDKKKTKMALKKAWKSFNNILPQFLGVIMFVGILLSVFNAELISKIVGSESGWIGVIFSAVVGAITLIPGFVAFPTAAMLLKSGAGYMQIGAFVSTLMMVGVVTAPVEMKYFGKRLTIIRNVLSFLFSFVVAYVIGKVASGI